MTQLLGSLSKDKTAEGGSDDREEKHSVGSSRGSCSNSLRLNFSSITFAVPLMHEVDFSALYKRCGQSINNITNASRSLVGLAMDNVSIEHGQTVYDSREANQKMPSKVRSLECDSLVVFVSSPDGQNATLGRTVHRIDLLGAMGRLEVDPHIPIAVEYRSNTMESEANLGKKTFPTVPAFSSFKARQEDDEEDNEIDRLLSENMHDVDFDRKALRAQDPQNIMLSEAANASAVLNVHIPQIRGDVSEDELEVILALFQNVFPKTHSTKTNVEIPSSQPPSIAISVACDTVSLSVHQESNQREKWHWSSFLWRFDRFRIHTVAPGSANKYVRFLSHETSFYESKCSRPGSFYLCCERSPSSHPFRTSSRFR